ncbi:MAG: hypothetical protein KC516_01820 [Nanoarchaeota archaeon]|nr:hypothetical protein [Nanoarchaeota archaeon]
MEERKSNTAHFINSYMNTTIEYNKATIKAYTNQIQKKLGELGISPKEEISNLEEISKTDNIGPWLALGEYFVGELEYGRAEVGIEAVEIAETYQKLTKKVGHKGFEDISKDILKVIDKHIKSKEESQ